MLNGYIWEFTLSFFRVFSATGCSPHPRFDEALARKELLGGTGTGLDAARSSPSSSLLPGTNVFLHFHGLLKANLGRPLAHFTV